MILAKYVDRCAARDYTRVLLFVLLFSAPYCGAESGGEIRNLFVASTGGSPTNTNTHEEGKVDRPLGALVRTNSVVMILETKPWSNTPAWRAPRTITIKENGKGVKIHPRELADVGTALLDAQVRVGQRRDVKVGERFRGFEIRWMRALPKEPTTRQ